MKSLAIIWVLIVTSITNVHAVLDGRVVPNSVMLVQPAAKNPSPVKVTTPDNVLNCSSQEASISPSPSSTRLGERMVKAGVVFLCKQKNLSYGRFTADSCNDSVACRKALRDSNSPNAEKLLNEIVAKDVA